MPPILGPVLDFRNPRRLAITLTGCPARRGSQTQHLRSIIRLKLDCIVGCIEDTVENLAHVVSSSMVPRQDVIQSFDWLGRRRGMRRLRNAGRQSDETAGESAKYNRRRPLPSNARLRWWLCGALHRPATLHQPTGQLHPGRGSGPPNPMKLVPLTMMMTSLRAGRYAPPAIHIPITAEICGTRNFRRISEL